MSEKVIASPREYDWFILLLAVFLTAVGVVMVYSSSAEMADTLKRYSGDDLYFLKRQAAYAALGFLAMFVTMRIDYKKLRPFAVPGLLICLLLLIAVFIPGLGSKAGGASRWLRIGINLQPVELAKIALILYMAHSLTKKQDKVKNFKLGVLPYMIVVGGILVLLLLQPDLGSAMTLVAVAAAMLFVAGMRYQHIASLIAILIPPFILLIATSSYRMKRIAAFFDPWQDPTDKGLQIIQSWIAIGSGGFFGKGLGEGRQKLFYLPEAHTDFILSVIGEEMGFIGFIVIVVCVYFLFRRGMHTAFTAPDDFGRYLAFGITFLLAFEAAFNMCVVLGLVPTKGLALPFISYGGSSLICTLAAIGILLNISSQTQIKAVQP
ncbi:MAG: putative lipid II flippase FtsW [Desulfuromonadales bacterium]|nr:putative lipid II flippase FtsW [Desulfuromonadales bacterium]